LSRQWIRYLADKVINKPTRFVLLGYASYVLLTWLLLCLPICWQADPISPLDNLFIATSAISTTGLVTVNTPDAYNYLGEFIVALAFQAGGLGYMTLGSFVILIREKNLPTTRENIGKVVFSLPEGFHLKTFIQHTIIFTCLVEVAGFIGLYIAFAQAEVPNAFWAAIFHSVSAFCTAGFSIFPNSLMDFRANLLVNVVISILSLLGAIGFIVVSDVWLSLNRTRRHITLTTRIILYATFSFIIAGWLFLFWADPSIVALPLGERILAAGFQAMTAMTTVGFTFGYRWGVKDNLHFRGPGNTLGISAGATGRGLLGTAHSDESPARSIRGPGVLSHHGFGWQHIVAHAAGRSF